MNSRMMEVGGMAAISAGLKALTWVRKLRSFCAFSYTGEDYATPYRRGSA